MEFVSVSKDKLGFENFTIVAIGYHEDQLKLNPGLIDFSNRDIEYIAGCLEQKIKLFELPYFDKKIVIQLVNIQDDDRYKLMQEFRISGSKAYSFVKKYGNDKIDLIGLVEEKDLVLSWIEGFALRAYTFDKYLSDKPESGPATLRLIGSAVENDELKQAEIIIKSTFIARDLVNEPGSVLTAVELSERIVELGKEAGFYTEIFSENKIESLKMGGLLAVNAGSIDPPTFSILEWKPEKSKNKKPIVLVGKGVVFDTGGLSLKPTTNSMDHMKSDMGGAAAVIGAIHAIAKLKLPIHVVGLIPATDNRPGQNAYYPGDVVRMYDGTTVEVLNTDAEGRMILADALAYAKKYDPELVINVATLTGAAMMATGKHGIVSFFKTEQKVKEDLKEAGFRVYERLVELPLWDEYYEMLKSDIADVKNIGGREAGAITAAKFLEKFTDYPFVHLDIAGVAFASRWTNYVSNGGTGVGVRLLTDYLIKF